MLVCVQSGWRRCGWLPWARDLSTPISVSLCHPGSFPARHLWWRGGRLALPCQPDVIRYGRILCCLHFSCLLSPLPGVCVRSPPTSIHRFYMLCTFSLKGTYYDMYFNTVLSLLTPAHTKKIWLHYPRFSAVSQWWAPANGKPVPQLLRGHDLLLSVPYSLTGCRDCEFEAYKLFIDIRLVYSASEFVTLCSRSLC